MKYQNVRVVIYRDDYAHVGFTTYVLRRTMIMRLHLIKRGERIYTNFYNQIYFTKFIMIAICFYFLDKFSTSFQPNLITYGDMNVVIIVIAPTIGSRNGLVTPTSAPPFATTSASSPPEEDKPNPALSDVSLLKPWYFVAKKTVKNFAARDTATKTRAGTMKSARRVISIKAPTDTKNKAANISLSGVTKTLVTKLQHEG